MDIVSSDVIRQVRTLGFDDFEPEAAPVYVAAVGRSRPDLAPTSGLGDPVLSPSVVAADNEVSAAVVGANEAVPYCLARAGHTHRQVQQ